MDTTETARKVLALIASRETELGRPLTQDESRGCLFEVIIGRKVSTNVANTALAFAQQQARS